MARGARDTGRSGTRQVAIARGALQACNHGGEDRARAFRLQTGVMCLV